VLRDEAVCCETRAPDLVLSFFALASQLRSFVMLVVSNVWLWLQYLVTGTLQPLSSLFSFGGLIEDPGRYVG
jgi:hypothetical protein